MTRGLPMRLVIVAGALFVGGVVALAFREHLGTLLVSIIVTLDLAAVGYLVVFAWRKR